MRYSVDAHLATAAPRVKIKDVSRRIGLTADVIRIWERRYAAVAPQRDANHRRIYGPGEVQRLLLLRDAVAGGHTISAIAALDDDALKQLVHDGGAPDESRLLTQLLMHIRAHDAAALQTLLTGIQARYAMEDFCDRIVTPLLHEVGEYWLRDASLIAKEHLATAAVGTVLDRARAQHDARAGKPLLFATIANERHDTGAKMAAAVAAEHGFATIVLAPGSTPAEIADVATRMNAAGVGVSVIYQHAEHTLHDLCKRVRVPLWVGGRLAPDGPWTRIATLRDFARELNGIQTKMKP